MAGIDLSLSGLASGFDWKSFFDQIIQVERAPEQRLFASQNTINKQNHAFRSIKNPLRILQSRVTDLKAGTLFDSRTATSSDSAAATALAAGGAALGNFTFNVTQLATAARITGTNNVGSPLNPTNDVSGLTLANAKFPVAVTAG